MSTTAKPSSKSARKTHIITLHLSPDTLSRFPHTPSPPKPSASPASVPKLETTPAIIQPDSSSADKSSESASTPAATTADTPDPNALAPPPKVDGRRKRGGAAAITGRKRAPPTIDPMSTPRERARPGPKKKPRLPDGSIDRTTSGPNPAPNPIPAHKLGPKANTGAINAGLRALDRTGKPCRRWQKSGLQLKSFTGTTWGMATWKAPPKTNGVNGDADDEMKSDSSSEVKMPDSSAVQSERSVSAVEQKMEAGEPMEAMASSPPPQPAVAAVA
ncbi:hypothetical protein B0A48_12344 [Cryoendolithus antarcticus]|uniref:INO80 complex subunit Ies4 n=1 Tax=Cryoendolithus antarcticus TaxID=1507870 RepID=A0A1V8SS87_9PEZI|nr:hypothetical protein B0A48_12344 [Cryoendolithus antarcticus]